MINLFQIMLRSDWSLVAFNMIDARGIGLAPQENYNQIWGFFVILFVLFGYLFLGEMFFCVIFEYSNITRHEFTGALMCNSEEQQWVNMQRFMLKRNLK